MLWVQHRAYDRERSKQTEDIEWVYKVLMKIKEKWGGEMWDTARVLLLLYDVWSYIILLVYYKMHAYIFSLCFRYSDSDWSSVNGESHCLWLYLIPMHIYIWMHLVVEPHACQRCDDDLSSVFRHYWLDNREAQFSPHTNIKLCFHKLSYGCNNCPMRWRQSHNIRLKKKVHFQKCKWCCIFTHSCCT